MSEQINNTQIIEESVLAYPINNAPITQPTQKYHILLNLFEQFNLIINFMKNSINKFIEIFKTTSCTTTHTEIKSELNNILSLLNNVNNFITSSKEKINNKIKVNDHANEQNNQLFKTMNDDVDFIMSLLYDDKTNTNNLLPMFNLFDKVNTLLDKIIETNDEGILCLLQTLYINLQYISGNINFNSVNYGLSNIFRDLCTNSKDVALDSNAIIIQKIGILLLSAPILIFMSFTDIQIKAFYNISELINKILLSIKKSLLLSVKVANYIDRKYCDVNKGNTNTYKLTKNTYTLYKFFIYSHKSFLAYVNALNNLKTKTKNISINDDKDTLIINLVKKSGINPDELIINDISHVSLGGLNTSSLNKFNVINSAEHFNSESIKLNIKYILIIILILIVIYIIYKKCSH